MPETINIEGVDIVIEDEEPDSELELLLLPMTDSDLERGFSVGGKRIA